MKRKNRLFDWIAPFYSLAYERQKKQYAGIVANGLREMDCSGYRTVIDIGCGTGALCSVLNQRGFSVTGLDSSAKMLEVGRRKPENKAVRFIQSSALERLPFEDKSFDVSFACYVAHGLPAAGRLSMYTEMKRITRHCVIIHDYNQKRALLTNIVEWAEHGDYFNFIRQAAVEMRQLFGEVRVFDVGERAAWYVGMAD